MPSERKSVTSYLTDQSYKALKAYADSFDCSLSKALEYLIQSSLLGQGAVGQGKVPHSTGAEELDALISEKISNQLQQLQQQIDEDQLQQKIQEVVETTVEAKVKTVEERLASLERKTRHLKEAEFEWLKRWIEFKRQQKLQQKQKEEQSNEDTKTSRTVENREYLNSLNSEQLRELCTEYDIKWSHAHGNNKHLKKAEMIEAILNR